MNYQKVAQMNFCPECGALLKITKKGNPALKCTKCKYQQPLKQETVNKKVIIHQSKAAEIVVIDKDEGEKLRQLPTIHVVCQACGNAESETWNVEAADETIHSTITFFRCTNCGATRRESG
jgi:DNA-directed RNA polymerase subunit M/transcription elongation factor TFIIS